jgi:integrase
VAKTRRIRPRCGHGHIDVLPSGAFRAEIMVNRERARATYPTEEEAQVFLERQIKNASAYGIGLDKSRIGVNQVAEWFMDEKRSQNLKATTLQDYQGSVDRFAAEWGALPVQRLTAAHITKLLAKLAKDGLSPKTRRNIYSTLRQMLAFAVNQNVTDRNEADRTKPPKIERQPPKAWSREQLRAFLAAIKGDRLEALWQVLACTGMRLGEVAALQWPDVDLDGAQITVRRRIVRLNSGLDVDRPKSRAGSRVVGLTDDAVTSLRAWQHQQRLERAAARSRWGRGRLGVHDLPGQQPGRLRRRSTRRTEGDPADVRRPHRQRGTGADQRAWLAAYGRHARAVEQRQRARRRRPARALAAIGDAQHLLAERAWWGEARGRDDAASAVSTGRAHVKCALRSRKVRICPSSFTPTAASRPSRRAG